MKLLILPSLCLLSSFSVAQTIPNSGFETWITDTDHPPVEFEHPEGWALEECVSINDEDWTCNLLAQKSTDARTGQYALKVQNTATNTGFAVTANNGDFGLPFTGTAASFSFYAKTSLYGDDKAEVYAFIIDEEINAYSTATTVISENYDSYTKFTLPFVVEDSSVVTTRILISFQIINDEDTYDPRSYILVDDLEVGTATNMAADLKSKAPVFYPNPVSDVLYLSKAMEYSVQDLMGKSYLSGNAGSISVASLPKGVYMLRTSDGSGAARLQKFVKQ